MKHIRKTRYALISPDNFWEKTMALKNRKQIPVCRNCHMNFIHAGKYQGTNLSNKAATIMYVNRLITIESQIHKGQERNYLKSLEEKGWKEVKKDKD